MTNNYQLWEEPSLKLSETLNQLLQQRDGYTGIHSQKVAILSSWIAQFLGLDTGIQKTFTIIGELHDIGKLIWPDFMFTAIKETETFSLYQWKQNHPTTAFKTLKSTFLTEYNYEWLIIILCHHWNYTGNTGSYPENALQIIRSHLRHLPDFNEARIIDALYNPIEPSLNSIDPNTLRLKIGILRAADSLEAATAARCYKKQKDCKKTITELLDTDTYHPNIKEVLQSLEFKTFFDSVGRFNQC